MITIEDRLRELPPQIAELALANYSHKRNASIRLHNGCIDCSNNQWTGNRALWHAFSWEVSPEGKDYWEAIHQGKSALFEAGKYYNDDKGSLWEIISVEGYFNDHPYDMPPTARVIGAPVEGRNPNWMGHDRKSLEWPLGECHIFSPGGSLSDASKPSGMKLALLPTPVDYSPNPVIYAWVKPPTSARALILD